MRRLLAILFLCLLPSLAHAGRQFDGTDDALVSASAINLSGSPSLSVSFWLWWDAFADDDDNAMTHGYDTATNYFRITPNNGSGLFTVGQSGNIGPNFAEYDRASISTGAWHHFVAILDRTQAADEVDLYLDGSIMTPANRPDVENNTDNFSSDELNIMRISAAFGGYGAGRIADVAIWTSVLSGGNITSLSGGTLPSAISPAPAYYWKICGTSSPETATTGGVNLTLVDAPTQVAHPSAITASCSAPPASSRRRRPIIFQ